MSGKEMNLRIWKLFFEALWLVSIWGLIESYRHQHGILFGCFLTFLIINQAGYSACIRFIEDTKKKDLGTQYYNELMNMIKTNKAK